MERKLASIRRIESIHPVDGADAIERARVMGWDVVIKRGEFAPGDPCVFFEVDSVLPEGAAWSELLRPRGFRVKTARLRGVLSQGLALPTSILPCAVPDLGADVTAVLGVRKHEPPVPLGAAVDGPFPEDVPRTDEIRLQSALGVLAEIAGRDFVVTTKLDGTSSTFYRSEAGELASCSRNWRLTPQGPAWSVATRLGLAERLPTGFAVQGELCGPGIQRNRLGLTEVDFFAFNVVDVARRRYLDHEEAHAFCADLGLRTVPVERVVRGVDAVAFDHSLDRWLELARGLYAGTANRKEGVVVRPLVEARSEALGGRLSFKVLNNDFLLKDDD